MQVLDIIGTVLFIIHTTITTLIILIIIILGDLTTLIITLHITILIMNMDTMEVTTRIMVIPVTIIIIHIDQATTDMIVMEKEQHIAQIQEDTVQQLLQLQVDEVVHYLKLAEEIIILLQIEQSILELVFRICPELNTNRLQYDLCILLVVLVRYIYAILLD